MASKLRVLLVEDEFILALEYELLLQIEGHEIVGVAAHAETALALARAHKPNLAIVDVNLRDGATGPEIAEYLIKALRVPVLFVTGSGGTLPDHLHGAIGLLGKPIAEQAFRETVRYIAGQINGTPSDAIAPPELRVPASLMSMQREAPPSRQRFGLQ